MVEFLVQRWRGLSIYRKVLALYFTCLIPVAAFAALAVEANANHAREQVLLGALQTADIAVANVSNFLDAVDTQMRMFAATPGVVQAPLRETKALFHRYLSLESNVDDLILVDSRGRILVQGIDLMRQELLAHEARLLETISRYREPRIVVDATHFAGRQRPLVFTQPVLRDDQPATLVAVVASWRIYKALNLDSRVQGAEVFLTSRQGEIIAHPQWMFAHQTPNLGALPPVTRAVHGQRGTITYEDPSHKRAYLGAYVQVPGTGWAMVVSYPESVALPPVRSTLFRGLAVLLLLVLAATFMATAIGRHIVHPLESLTRAVEAIAGGDFRQRVPADGDDELGRLMTGFNRMTRNLRDMASGLHRAREEVASKAKQLGRLLRRSVDIQEEERRRIAMHLHDGLLQMMAGTHAGVQALRARQELGSDTARELKYVEELLKSQISETRHIVYDLRPPRLESGGLAAALEHAAEHLSSTTHLRVDIETLGVPRRLPSEVELGLFRAVQESLQNVIKHAKASRVRIGITFGDGDITVHVEDDGRGFSPDRAQRTDGAGGLGLFSMRERLDAVGGSLTVDSERGKGTRLQLHVPLQPAATSRGAQEA